MKKSKEYKGSEIITEYDSTNIKKAVYNIKEKTLRITFNTGTEYDYAEVPHEVFAAFDNAESQGKFFNTSINKKFTHKKVITENEGNV